MPWSRVGALVGLLDNAHHSVPWLTQSPLANKGTVEAQEVGHWREGPLLWRSPGQRQCGMELAGVQQPLLLRQGLCLSGSLVWEHVSHRPMLYCQPGLGLSRLSLSRLTSSYVCCRWTTAREDKEWLVCGPVAEIECRGIDNITNRLKRKATEACLVKGRARTRKCESVNPYECHGDGRPATYREIGRLSL